MATNIISQATIALTNATAQGPTGCTAAGILSDGVYNGNNGVITPSTSSPSITLTFPSSQGIAAIKIWGVAYASSVTGLTITADGVQIATTTNFNLGGPSDTPNPYEPSWTGSATVLVISWTESGTSSLTEIEIDSATTYFSEVGKFDFSRQVGIVEKGMLDFSRPIGISDEGKFDFVRNVYASENGELDFMFQMGLPEKGKVDFARKVSGTLPTIVLSGLGLTT